MTAMIYTLVREPRGRQASKVCEGEAGGEGGSVGSDGDDSSECSLPCHARRGVAPPPHASPRPVLT